MKPQKKTLQKFTDTEAKIKKILALDSITHDDLIPLSKEELRIFEDLLRKEHARLNDTEREQFFKKIEPIMAEESRNSNWEYNHSTITYAISNFMSNYGRMPSTTELAEKAGLSRQTVHKHLKEYATHPLYLEQVEQYKFMADRVLAKVFTLALSGDMSAAKLYLSMLSNPETKKNNNTLIHTQNNYLQINGTKISQDKIKHLSAEQLNNIEAILQAALPEPLK